MNAKILVLALVAFAGIAAAITGCPAQGVVGGFSCRGSPVYGVNPAWNQLVGFDACGYTNECYTTAPQACASGYSCLTQAYVNIQYTGNFIRLIRGGLTTSPYDPPCEIDTADTPYYCYAKSCAAQGYAAAVCKLNPGSGEVKYGFLHCDTSGGYCYDDNGNCDDYGYPQALCITSAQAGSDGINVHPNRQCAAGGRYCYLFACYSGSACTGQNEEDQFDGTCICQDAGASTPSGCNVKEDLFPCSGSVESRCVQNNAACTSSQVAANPPSFTGAGPVTVTITYSGFDVSTISNAPDLEIDCDYDGTTFHADKYWAVEKGVGSRTYTCNYAASAADRDIIIRTRMKQKLFEGYEDYEVWTGLSPITYSEFAQTTVTQYASGGGSGYPDCSDIAKNGGDFSTVGGCEHCLCATAAEAPAGSVKCNANDQCGENKYCYITPCANQDACDGKDCSCTAFNPAPGVWETCGLACGLISSAPGVWRCFYDPAAGGSGGGSDYTTCDSRDECNEDDEFCACVAQTYSVGSGCTAVGGNLNCRIDGNPDSKCLKSTIDPGNLNAWNCPSLVLNPVQIADNQIKVDFTYAGFDVSGGSSSPSNSVEYYCAAGGADGNQKFATVTGLNKGSGSGSVTCTYSPITSATSREITVYLHQNLNDVNDHVLIARGEQTITQIYPWGGGGSPANCPWNTASGFDSYCVDDDYLVPSDGCSIMTNDGCRDETKCVKAQDNDYGKCATVTADYDSSYGTTGAFTVDVTADYSGFDVDTESNGPKAYYRCDVSDDYSFYGTGSKYGGSFSISCAYDAIASGSVQHVVRVKVEQTGVGEDDVTITRGYDMNIVQQAGGSSGGPDVYASCDQQFPEEADADTICLDKANPQTAYYKDLGGTECSDGKFCYATSSCAQQGYMGTQCKVPGEQPAGYLKKAGSLACDLVDGGDGFFYRAYCYSLGMAQLPDYALVPTPCSEQFECSMLGDTFGCFTDVEKDAAAEKGFVRCGSERCLEGKYCYVIPGFSSFSLANLIITKPANGETYDHYDEGGALDLTFVVNNFWSNTRPPGGTKGLKCGYELERVGVASYAKKERSFDVTYGYSAVNLVNFENEFEGLLEGWYALHVTCVVPPQNVFEEIIHKIPIIGSALIKLPQA
ncbi:MAG: hypothetical protein WC607_04840, partial [Candidatus Micrarchaeia archaeon]